jgi:hypothetical protein
MKMVKDPVVRKIVPLMNVIPAKCDEHHIKGFCTIQKIRKYQIYKGFEYEVDLQFQGEIHAYHSTEGVKWYGPEIKGKEHTSSRKINSFIRRHTFSCVYDKLRFFIKMEGRDHVKVKKVTWV